LLTHQEKKKNSLLPSTNLSVAETPSKAQTFQIIILSTNPTQIRYGFNSQFRNLSSARLYSFNRSTAKGIPRLTYPVIHKKHNYLVSSTPPLFQLNYRILSPKVTLISCI
jgi:hypothetical protein